MPKRSGSEAGPAPGVPRAAAAPAQEASAARAASPRAARGGLRSGPPWRRPSVPDGIRHLVGPARPGGGQGDLPADHLRLGAEHEGVAGVGSRIRRCADDLHPARERLEVEHQDRVPGAAAGRGGGAGGALGHALAKGAEAGEQLPRSPSPAPHGAGPRPRGRLSLLTRWRRAGRQGRRGRALGRRGPGGEGRQAPWRPGPGDAPDDGAEGDCHHEDCPGAREEVPAHDTRVAKEDGKGERGDPFRAPGRGVAPILRPRPRRGEL
jgi:hypothetical protein